MTSLVGTLVVFGYCIISIYSASIGECTKLTASSPQEALGITCLGVVDYSYFLPANLTSSLLDAIAKEKLSDDRLSILPVKCQTSLKKAVCSQVYLKCPNNFNQTNYATYNYGIFSDIQKAFPIPFERPCLNICDDVNRECLGLLKLFGRHFDCKERFDYSYHKYNSLVNASYAGPFPYIYDQSPSSIICNAMPAVALVAGGMEPYLGKTCAGIVTSVYVPPGPKVSLLLAPMQSPYVVQTIIENEIKTALDALPPFLSQECHLSIRKFICGSGFLHPQAQIFPGKYIYIYLYMFI